MGGEHFSSSTGKDLDKQKNPYVRFRWETKKGEKRPKQTILEQRKTEENKELATYLRRCYGEPDRFLEGVEKEVTKCVVCQEPESWPLLRFEFYNWEKAGTEREAFTHDECLKNAGVASLFEGLRLMGKNPTVFLELNCKSFDKCGFFSPAHDFRNCGHIVLRFDEVKRDEGGGMVEIEMSPMLYCKRAHPGEFYLETEEESYWNIENAGLALMGKRLVESLKTPALQAQIEIAKKQNPEFIQGLRKILAENPSSLMLSGFTATLFAQALAEKTVEEKWEEIQEGNDYY